MKRLEAKQERKRPGRYIGLHIPEAEYKALAKLAAEQERSVAAQVRLFIAQGIESNIVGRRAT